MPNNPNLPFQFPKPESEYDEIVIQNIRSRGWHIFHIRSESNQPPFAFTLGLYGSYGHPEVVLFGLPPTVAQQILEAIADAVKIKRTKFRKDKKYEKLVLGFPVVFNPIAQKSISEYLGYGEWLYKYSGLEFSALQLIWPDRLGIFPFESGYDSSLVKVQPLL